MTPEAREQKMARIKDLNRKIYEVRDEIASCQITFKNVECGGCRRRSVVVGDLVKERDALAAEIEGRTPDGDINDLPLSARPKRERPVYVEGDDPGIDETAVLRERIAVLEQEAERRKAKHKRATLKITALVAEVAEQKKANAEMARENIRLVLAKNNTRAYAQTVAGRLDQATAENGRLASENALLRQNAEAKSADTVVLNVTANGADPTEVAAQVIASLPDPAVAGWAEATSGPKKSKVDPVRREIALSLAVDLNKAIGGTPMVLTDANAYYKFLMGEES